MKKTPNRWFILAAAILTNLSLGAGYAWSVFQKALLEANASQGWVQAQTSLAFSISFAMVPIGMILFGPKVDSLGPKKFVFLGGILFGAGMFATGFATSLPVLYLTYGVVLGLGIGSAYGASTSVATKWFPDKKGLAGGLTAAGFGLGPLIIGPLAKTLIASMGVYRLFVLVGFGLYISSFSPFITHRRLFIVFYFNCFLPHFSIVFPIFKSPSPPLFSNRLLFWSHSHDKVFHCIIARWLYISTRVLCL